MSSLKCDTEPHRPEHLRDQGVPHDVTSERGRFWQLKLLLLAYLAYAGVRHLTDPDFASIFSGVTFGVHELGHLVFAFFGEWISAAGGSLAQVLLPVGAALLFLRQRDRFGVAVCGAWLAMSLANLAVYIGDARAEALDLVSFSPEGAVHDWNYLLGSLRLLEHDTQIAGFVRAIGWLLLAGSIGGGAAAAMRSAPPATE